MAKYVGASFNKRTTYFNSRTINQLLVCVIQQN